MYEHPYSVQGEIDVLPRWFALGQFDRTGDRSSMEPSIRIDSECLTGEGAEMCGLLYALEQGK
jgi:hypothetical protein